MPRFERYLAAAGFASFGLCAYGCGLTSDGGAVSGASGDGGAAAQSTTQAGAPSSIGGQDQGTAGEGVGQAGDSAGPSSAGAAGEPGAGAAGEAGVNSGGSDDAGGAGPGGGCSSAAAASDDGGSGSSVADATIDYVSPNVAYLDEQQGVVIRGTHFPVNASVCFGNQPAASVERKSASEIRAIPPLIHVPGRVPITLGGSAAQADSHTELTVRAHPSYAPAVVITDVGFQERHALYDAERDAVFSYCSWFGNYSAKTPSTIQRYAYDAATGSWSTTSSYVPELWDIALSPDGKYLIALGTSRLWLLDPVTFNALDFVDFSQASFGTAGQLAVTNDGKVLIRDLGKAYSLVDKTFSAAAFPGAIGIVISADGGRGVVGDANSSASVPLSIYDASTGLITPSNALEYFQVPSLDRTGSRYFSGGNLRDRELSLIGGVPTYMGFMSADGKHAYEIDSVNRTHIHVYNLVGSGPTFPQLDDLVLTDTIDGYWLHGSLDSRFLFIPGPDKFIVAPVP
ncbi:MAG: IPT/TIG domain-containing protein [Polyangiaceae bacterium]